MRENLPTCGGRPTPSPAPRAFASSWRAALSLGRTMLACAAITFVLPAQAQLLEDLVVLPQGKVLSRPAGALHSSAPP